MFAKMMKNLAGGMFAVVLVIGCGGYTEDELALGSDEELAQDEAAVNSPYDPY
jgi:hypothetical protein